MKLEYKTLKEKVKEYNKKDAKFYGNMFAKLNKLETTDINVSSSLNGLLPALLRMKVESYFMFMPQKSAAKEAEPMSIDSKA